MSTELRPGRERLTRPVRDGSWNGRAAYDTCERIAASFLEFWDEHRALLAVIDLAATEGDVRFREIRLQLLMSFTALMLEELSPVYGWVLYIPGISSKASCRPRS